MSSTPAWPPIARSALQLRLSLLCRFFAPLKVPSVIAKNNAPHCGFFADSTAQAVHRVNSSPKSALSTLQFAALPHKKFASFCTFARSLLPPKTPKNSRVLLTRDNRRRCLRLRLQRPAHTLPLPAVRLRGRLPVSPSWPLSSHPRWLLDLHRTFGKRRECQPH